MVMVRWSTAIKMWNQAKLFFLNTVACPHTSQCKFLSLDSCFYTIFASFICALCTYSTFICILYNSPLYFKNIIYFVVDEHRLSLVLGYYEKCYYKSCCMSSDSLVRSGNLGAYLEVELLSHGRQFFTTLIDKLNSFPKAIAPM